MERLPDQVRSRHQQRDRNGNPQLWPSQATPWTADRDPEQTAHQQRRGQDLDLHRHPGQHSGEDPGRPPLRFASHRSDQPPHGGGSGQHVERRRLEQMPDRQGQGRHGHRRSGRQLMARRRAELPGDQTAEQHVAARCQRRQNPEGPQPATHQLVPACRQVRNHHRIVRRSNLQMTPSHHKVELVTVKPVPASDEQQGKNHHPGNHPDGHRQPRPIRPASQPPGRRHDRRHDIDRTPNLRPRTRPPQLTAAPRLRATARFGTGVRWPHFRRVADFQGLNTAASTWGLAERRSQARRVAQQAQRAT